MADVYEYDLQTLTGDTLPLAAYRGKVMLIVNVASQCGFTPQYKGLQALHEKYAERGLVVLGCPCNQFGSQEPGDAGQIATFCETSFGVSFPMSAKLKVNGSDADPLWKHLTTTKPGLLGSTAVKWNFTKFLVNRQGQVVERYAPNTAPEDIASDIEALL